MIALLFPFLLLHSDHGVGKMEKRNLKSHIVVDLGPLPADADPSSIGSVSKYLYLSHVVRTPIVIDRTASIKGGLAESWEVSADQTEYKLRFKRTELFNDGSPITAKNFLETISFRRALKSQIHFDFNLIRSAELTGDVVTLKLTKALPLFITNLSQPEFGILHPSTIKDPKAGPLFCSGYYCLESFEKDKIVLTKNRHVKSTGPESVMFLNTGLKKYDMLKSGDLNFILEFGDIPKDLALEASGRSLEIVEPHIGFTHWVTLNPRRKSLASETMRSIIQTELKSQFLKFDFTGSSYEVAEQLFLPGGPGRLEKDETANIWKTKSGKVNKSDIATIKGKSLKALITDKFEFRERIVKAFEETSKKLGFKTEIILYHNQQELQDLVSKGDFDFLLINNDFSGFDLTLSVAVTFNPQRPLLIAPEAGQLIQKLELLSSEAVLEKRSKLLKEISKLVLSESVATPLLYKRASFIKEKNLDISSWSMLFPEVAFWKSELR